MILDADSAQRACIAAALAGRSFTIDGPPGTGKSQTIANMVGALLFVGKTVLVVSHKAAALDVVADRLADAGLGGYLLELHSHKATRKEVAASLAAAVDTAPAVPAAAPDTGMAPEQREQLERVRLRGEPGAGAAGVFAARRARDDREPACGPCRARNAAAPRCS